MDALRGVAALCVVEFHAIGLSATLFRHAYLAVDFFFLLSGFVLSYAYGDRLDKGWSTWKFLKTRWIRLWPLNTLGLLLGFTLALMGISVIKVHVAMAQHWLYLPLNLFFIPVDLRSPEFPMFPTTRHAGHFSLRLSATRYTPFFRRIRTPLLIALSSACGVLYVWRVWVAGTANIGLQVNSIDGYVRVLFPYTVGMLFFGCGGPDGAVCALALPS
jgi:peptidoglycan/LPS O-acetylase OafA/YrhL